MARVPSVTIPPAGSVTLRVQDREVRLTNLDKLFWTTPRITKGELIQYYADVAPVLLPHIRDRAMVMVRPFLPPGDHGAFRAPRCLTRVFISSSI